MKPLAVEGLLLGQLTLDFCFPCQVVWFDAHESTQLSPGGVIEVFKAFDQHRATTSIGSGLVDVIRAASRAWH